MRHLKLCVQLGYNSLHPEKEHLLDTCEISWFLP